MLISELAGRTGLSPDTIRHYEKAGLLLDGSHLTRSPNNYRRHTTAAIERLEFVKRAKMLGFTLAEIKNVIGDWETDKLSLAEKKNLILNKIAVIKRQIQELNDTKNYLQEKHSLLENGE